MTYQKSKYHRFGIYVTSMVLCRYEDIYQPCHTDAKSMNSNNDNQWYYNYWIMWIIILFVCFDSGPATYDKHCFLKLVNTGTIIFFGLLNRCSTQNICGADFAGSNDSMEVYPANLLRSCIFLMKFGEILLKKQYQRCR